MKKRTIALFLLAHLLLVVFIGAQKTNYHIDELYTFTLANRYGARLAPDITDGQVYSGDGMFGEYLTVQPEHTFDYGLVYQNQRNDAHLVEYVGALSILDFLKPHEQETKPTIYDNHFGFIDEKIDFRLVFIPELNADVEVTTTDVFKKYGDKIDDFFACYVEPEIFYNLPDKEFEEYVNKEFYC